MMMLQKPKGLIRSATSGAEFKQQELQANKDLKLQVLEGNLTDVLESFDLETGKSVLAVYVRKSHLHYEENKYIDMKVVNNPIFINVISKYFAFTGIIELSREISALKHFNISSNEYPCLAQSFWRIRLFAV